MYVEVQVSVSAKQVDRPFHYYVPPALEKKIQPGMRVEVPFGPRKTEAFVLNIIEKTEVKKIKAINKLLDNYPLITKELLDLSAWIGKYYLCSRSIVLQTMLPFPVGIKKKEVKHAKLTLEKNDVDEVLALLLIKAPRQGRVIKYLRENKEESLPRLLKATNSDYSVIKTLENKGYISLSLIDISRDPFIGSPLEERKEVTLSLEQKNALTLLESSLIENKSKTFLLHGVTGSGKTEIYLRIIEKALKQGKGAIVMVPEISLTPQMIQRFRSFFGSRVALLHSRLSQGERYDEWCRLLSGAAQIAVGPRSAIFAPVNNLGVLILDEEHERTYKQEERPRYHAADVAQERALRNNALLLLGSATPSLESYYKGKQGEYTLIELSKRVTGKDLPPVSVVDMREELKSGNKKMFSTSLLTALEEVVENKEKALLFLNRRGHSTCVLCRECGLVIRCPSCDISLTFHSYDSKLICHYCNHTSRAPDICPSCKSRYIKFFGVGTQKIEEEIRKIFPTVGIWRMDMDTTSRKDAHRKILESFQHEGAGILIGTQMIAKGLDIPEITLVGVITADTGLNFPDFRASERTFQLLTQVAGRAGRGQTPGRVIVQTYAPQHYSILTAKEHDFKSFYDEEIESRRELLYPPFSYLLRLVLTGQNEEVLERASKDLLENLRRSTNLNILGPAPCPFKKVKDYFRWHIVFRGKSLEKLRQGACIGVDFINKHYSDIKIIVDVEPLNML